MSKRKLFSRKVLSVVILFLVFSVLASSRADALVKVVSTYIDMLGNSIYNVGYLNTTGWINGTSINGTYYGNGANLQNINTYNATYDAKVSDNATWNETMANAIYQGAAGNTTDQVFTVINNNSFVPISNTAYKYYNYTTADVTNGVATWSEVMTLPLSAGKKIEIECILFEWSNATTNGIQHRINITGSTDYKITSRYFTSATAMALCQANDLNVACAAANSGGAIIQPTEIYAYSAQTDAGSFIIEMRPELAGNPVGANTTSGSWCKSIEK